VRIRRRRLGRELFRARETWWCWQQNIDSNRPSMIAKCNLTTTHIHARNFPSNFSLSFFVKDGLGTKGFE
jgi:hypothetical protein